MSATEEWLRYIENRSIMQRYGVKGYTESESDPEESDKIKDEKTKDQESV